MENLDNVVGPDEFASPASLDSRNELQDQHGTHPLPWMDWLREQIAITPGSWLLELGSGSGDLWQEGFGSSTRIVLSDLSLGMLAEARDRQSGNGLRLAALNAEAIPFPERTTGTVVAVGVLDLVPDLQSALAEIRRVLRPGGMLYATAGGRFHLGQLQELVQPFIPEASLGGDADRFGVENGEKLLAGFFPAVERAAYRDELVFDRAEPVLEYVLSEEAIRSRLTGDDLPRFVSYVHQYVKRIGELRVRRVKALFTARAGG